MKKIINKLRYLKKWRKKVLLAPTDYKVSFYTKMKYALKGFTVNEYIWYDLKNNSYKDYISDFERTNSRELNGDYKLILDDKLLFEEVFRNYIRVPKNFGYIVSGHIHSLHDCNINNNNIIDFIKEKETIVLKMLKGYGGKGVFIIKYIDNKFLLNGEKTTIKDLKKLLESCEESIICEYITQTDFENSFYDKSTNTIRIVCAKKKGENYAKIRKAVQRIGNDYCAPVDNLCAGGLVAEIDIETGRLSHAIAKYGPMENRMKKMSNHPDNNNQIEGKIIPNWEKIKKEIEEVTNKIPYLKFIAWDVLLTDKGICIIEANASSSVDLFQLNHGIKKEEYGEILKSYGFFK